MKLGAEPKKLGFLVVLTVAAGYLLYTNYFSSSAEVPEAKNSHTPASSARPRPASAAPAAPQPAAVSRPATTRRSTQEFRPSLKSQPGAEPSIIDPRLRLDLLAKVQAVEAVPAQRNLFQFGAAAVPGLAGGKDLTVHPKPPGPGIGNDARAVTPSGPPGPPPAPPITLKYYGYIAQRSDGHKRAFFLDGDDILVAGEGDMMKRRYKVVRIGVNSVTVEDTQFNNTQTLPLAEETAG
jgi:hypothetical protein